MIATTAVDIGKAVFFFPILEPHGKRTAVAYLATMVFEMAYQIGQLSLAFGALFLCALLYRAGLVPKWLAAWGIAGYALHFVGAGAEIFGTPISLVLLIPGGIFEVTLAIWLLIKGFTPRAVSPSMR